MNTKIPRSLLFAIVLILTLALAEPVQAHAGEPRLEISPDRINPGGVVDVRGVDFEPEELIILALVGNGAEFPLGEIVANEEGIFLQIITLPVDLLEGDYRFRATTDDHEIMSPVLTVFGMAAAEGGEPLRDEDDPLFAPMPTFAPGVVPGGVSQPTAQAAPRGASVSNLNLVLLVALVFLVAASLLLVKSRVARKN